MKQVNLFFTFNINSTLTAMMAIEKEYKNDINILCVEKLVSRDPLFYKINGLVAKGLECFDLIIEVETQQYIFGKKDFLKAFKYINYYKKIYYQLLDRLKEQSIKKIDRVFTSQAGRIWPFFYKNGSRLYLIEHGFGDYYFLDKYYNTKVSLNDTVNTFWSKLFGYNFMNSSVKLSGAYLSMDLIDIKNEEIVYLNNSIYLNNLVEKFWKDFEDYYKQCFQEIKNLLQLSKESRTYFYLPSNEVKDEYYEDFLQKQIEKFNLSKESLIILKEHPDDSSEVHLNLLKKYFTNVYSFNEPLNKYIPIEFYAVLFKDANIIGTSSTAFVYLKKLYNNNNILIFEELFDKYKNYLKQDDPREKANSNKFFLDIYFKALEN